MPDYENIISEMLSKSTVSGKAESINDLKDKEFSGFNLSEDEKKALKNFESFRIKVLNQIKDEDKFHLTYRKFQVLANLSPWTDFLRIPDNF